MDTSETTEVSDVVKMRNVLSARVLDFLIFITSSYFPLEF